MHKTLPWILFFCTLTKNNLYGIIISKEENVNKHNTKSNNKMEETTMTRTLTHRRLRPWIAFVLSAILLIQSTLILSFHVSAENESIEEPTIVAVDPALQDELILLTQKGIWLRDGFINTHAIYTAPDADNLYAWRNATRLNGAESTLYDFDRFGEDCDFSQFTGDKSIRQKEFLVSTGLFPQRTDIIISDGTNTALQNAFFLFSMEDGVTQSDIESVWLAYFADADMDKWMLPFGECVSYEGKTYLSSTPTQYNKLDGIDLSKATFSFYDGENAVLSIEVSDPYGNVQDETVRFEKKDSGWRISGGTLLDASDSTAQTGDDSVFSVIAVSVSVLALGAVAYRRKRTI